MWALPAPLFLGSQEPHLQPPQDCPPGSHCLPAPVPCLGRPPGPMQPLQGGVSVATHGGVAENPQRGASQQTAPSYWSHYTERLLQQNL